MWGRVPPPPFPKTRKLQKCEIPRSREFIPSDFENCNQASRWEYTIQLKLARREMDLELSEQDIGTERDIRARDWSRKDAPVHFDPV